MVLASNGGVVAAARDALRHGLAGSLSSGLHHARRGFGAGFCTFNGLVIAAREALAAGAESILILDLDAHCGGGTASLIASEPHIWQADISVDGFDYYDDAGPGHETSGGPERDGRLGLRFVTKSGDYLHEIERGLENVGRRAPRFDLCLYNAGMDPFEGCSTGGLRGITQDILATRERLVFEWCRTRVAAVAFVLAGGYVGWGLDADGLVDLHRLTLSGAAESGLARVGA
jgi:acetoin utilization deacetylase AcuC-like enzyme